MGYRSLRHAVDDLKKTQQLVQIEQPIDPFLEAAEIQRRVYAAGGPAILMTNVKGTKFPILANLFGSLQRTRFLFREELEHVHKLVELKADPERLKSQFWRYLGLPRQLLRTLPKMNRSGPILACETKLSSLPQIQSWPADGGAFVTLPLVYSEHPDARGWSKSNLGMYRVQISGNDYLPNSECGLHYQIHRGIGVHHAAAIRRNEILPVLVIVGGPPALSVAAVMPLPEGMPELAFAGVLGGRRLDLVMPRSSTLPDGIRSLPMPAEADFVIEGYIDPTRTKPEGPFGDHLGYYSLKHEFPVMTVTRVHHRKDAIWPFTVVGRPPQEDTSFGEFIHELTGAAIPSVLPGVHAVHAVDAAGVHPLLLAIGSERYVPYAEIRRPQELLTQANAILGQGQLSLAKYLMILAKEDQPDLDIHDVSRFFCQLLERIDWQVDLHFQTRTTIDTLDYSAGKGLNAGSKVVMAAAGPKRRSLATELPRLSPLPEGFSRPCVARPGVLAIQAPAASGRTGLELPLEIARLIEHLEHQNLDGFPLVVVVDDSEFVARHLNNFLWAVFTRSDPAQDIHGVRAQTRHKHWGCAGPLVIDARWKPHMPTPLVEDQAVSRRVDSLAARGGPLHGIL